jgi:selenocysteine-specific elongation factor
MISTTRSETPLHVVATAGHVDHGKSSLILRLTGIDPDRLEEEKRRGLTIDLGFAWCTLPSGREVGFVDVPGHERFLRNMLAGIGPVRLVLFVVAADEGWKPQSEEHLAIVDVLGAHAGVVALTKRDLVDQETLALAIEETRERLAGTALEDAPVVVCSAATKEGLDELAAALDAMVAGAPAPEDDGRPRLFVDRIFTIKGAGTVVTGTLTGGAITVGEEVELYPTGQKARVRGLQTHKRAIEVARPVSRVAVNLTGIERTALERGDVLGKPGQWRGTAVLEARVRPVRGLSHPLTPRAAYKLYAGSAERDARVRFFGDPASGSFARIRLSRPMILDAFDRFVLRDVGRRETVAGGTVLDPSPPTRPGPDAERRLSARERASRDELAALIVSEKGAVRAEGIRVPGEVQGARRVGAWLVDEAVHAAAAETLERALARFHETNPLLEGTDISEARREIAGALGERGIRGAAELVDALLDDLERTGLVARSSTSVRLASHRVELAEEDVDDLVSAVRRGEPSPPTVDELETAGFARELIDAVARAGALVRVSQEILFTKDFIAKAESLVMRAGRGITVSEFREQLGTTRKYALPILEYFDHSGVTRRDGDLRFPRR